MADVRPPIVHLHNELTRMLEQASALKDAGNKAFAAKDYDTAIDLFTQAIALDSSNHVLFSNRSAAKAGKKQWDEALDDAEQVRLLRFVMHKQHLKSSLEHSA
jgi:tetratricopeptide (TPR) repeat protein